MTIYFSTKENLKYLEVLDLKFCIKEKQNWHSSSRNLARANKMQKLKDVYVKVLHAWLTE